MREKLRARARKLPDGELEFWENLTALAIRIELNAKAVMYGLDQPEDVDLQAQVITSAQKIRRYAIEEKARRREQVKAGD